MPDQNTTEGFVTSNDDTVTHKVAVEVTGLGKRFGREWIFRDMTLTFNPGKTYAITGPNGSGKSTLLQILWGQLPPSSGTIRYDTATNRISADDIAAHVAIATPYMDLIDEFTLMEQLRFHFRLRSIRNDLSLNELVEILYLENASDKFISNFSSGMKQRLKLGLAMYTNASLVFLDEPGTNLDQRAFEWYQREMNKIRGRCTLFIASNNAAEFPSDAENIAITDYKRAR